MRRRRSAAPQAASVLDGDSGPDSAGGELVGDLDGPLAVVGSDGTVTRLPLVMAPDRLRPVAAVGPDGSVAALGRLQPQAFVDPSEAAAPLDRGWRIEWAVSAEDRWHIASREAAVRSGLVDDVPVTETAMRLPGGDVVQRVSAARRGPSRGLLLEFENRSPGPVSLALAVIENDAWRGDNRVRRPQQPHDSALEAERGGERTRSAIVVEVRGARLMVNGQVALELGGTPGGAVAVADGGVWTAVAAGPASGDRQSRSRSGRAAAAVVVPLVPGVPVRATVPIDGVLDQGAARGAAASGWQALVARAATVSLPEETAERAWRRGIAASILAAGCGGVLSSSGWMNPCERRSDSHRGMVAPAVRVARTAVVLDRVGLPDEADRARQPLLEAADAGLLSGEEADAALWALSSRRLRSGRESGLADMAGRLAHQADDSLQRHTLEQVAAALDAEAPAAARDARRMLSDLAAAPSGQSRHRFDLAAVLRRSVAFGGDGLDGLEALVDCLVAEAEDCLVMAPSMPDEWIGAPVDVRGLITRHGKLSFSVRWHGTRPALLWELVPPTPSPPSPPALRCGLDKSWTTSISSGETLLR